MSDELYDFETQLEDGFALAMTEAGLIASTPRNFARFIQDRPRVDLLFTTGAEKQSFHIVNGERRNATWGGVLGVAIVANGDGEGSVEHRQYRAKVRRVMADLRNHMNDLTEDGTAKKYLRFLHIQNIRDQGTSVSQEVAKGVESSAMQYAIDFGVDQAAWAELTA